MGKHYVSEKNIISVYRFMSMCGLECKHKKHVRISHAIMEKKLKLRHEKFSKEVILPKKISFDGYQNEDVLKGDILEVVDDYNKVIAYQNPLRLKEEILLETLIKTADKKTLEKIRETILNEQDYIIQGNGEIVKKRRGNYE